MVSNINARSSQLPQRISTRSGMISIRDIDMCKRSRWEGRRRHGIPPIRKETLTGFRFLSKGDLNRVPDPSRSLSEMDEDRMAMDASIHVAIRRTSSRALFRTRWCHGRGGYVLKTQVWEKKRGKLPCADVDRGFEHQETKGKRLETYGGRWTSVDLRSLLTRVLKTA